MHVSELTWQQLVDKANKGRLESGETLVRPATNDEIASLRRRAAECGFAVDENFLAFLRYANGISYNGLTIPRAEIDPSRRSIRDFVIYNDRKSFIEEGPVYGNIDDEYYVLYGDGKFRRLGAGDPDYVLSTHDTFFDMVPEALQMAVLPTLP